MTEEKKPPQPPDPLHTFRFEVSFEPQPFESAQAADEGANADGAFAECTGLEATMEPKVIKEGGRNYGAVQRAGPVTFATVVLKRGIVRSGRLFNWFQRVASGDYASRCTVTITLKMPPQPKSADDAKEKDKNANAKRAPEPDDRVAMKWQLQKALPIKFKAADFNARATDVGIEELHLAHEGLLLVPGESVS